MATHGIVGTIYNLFCLGFCIGDSIWFRKPNQMKWLDPSFLEDFIWAHSPWPSSYSSFIYGACRLTAAIFLYAICFFFLIIIIDRIKLSSISIIWKLFWQISYRKDTLLKGVLNSRYRRRESNSHHLKAVKSWKPSTLSTTLIHFSKVLSFFSICNAM